MGAVGFIDFWLGGAAEPLVARQPVTPKTSSPRP